MDGRTDGRTDGWMDGLYVDMYRSIWIRFVWSKAEQIRLDKTRLDKQIKREIEREREGASERCRYRLSQTI